MAQPSPVRGVLRRLAGAAPAVLPDRTLQAMLAVRSRLSPTIPTAGLPAANHVLVVAPHPDDETIMAGGTIAMLTDRGTQVTLVCVTDGEASLAGLAPNDLAGRRRAEVEAAAADLGVADVLHLGLPDRRVADHADELVGALADQLNRTAADIVIVPWFGDDHPDHLAAAGAVAAAVDRAGHAPTEIWGGEAHTPGPVTRTVDITPVIDRKRRALARHATAARAFDLDATLGLNRHRSLVNQRGRGWAEGFVAADTATWIAWQRRARAGGLDGSDGVVGS